MKYLMMLVICVCHMMCSAQEKVVEKTLNFYGSIKSMYHSDSTKNSCEMKKITLTFSKSTFKMETEDGITLTLVDVARNPKATSIKDPQWIGIDPVSKIVYLLGRFNLDDGEMFVGAVALTDVKSLANRSFFICTCEMCGDKKGSKL